MGSLLVKSFQEHHVLYVHFLSCINQIVLHQFYLHVINERSAMILILDFHRGMNIDFWFWGLCTVWEVSLPTAFWKPPSDSRPVKMGPTAVSETSSVNSPLTPCTNRKNQKWACRIAAWERRNLCDEKVRLYSQLNIVDSLISCKNGGREFTLLLLCIACLLFGPKLQMSIEHWIWQEEIEIPQ